MSVANRLIDLQAQAQVSDMTLLEVEITEAAANELYAMASPARGSPTSFMTFSGIRIRVREESVFVRAVKALREAAEAAVEMRDIPTAKKILGVADELERETK